MDDQLIKTALQPKNQKLCLVVIFFLFNYLLFIYDCHAQSYTRCDTIPVEVNGNWLKNPWGGGFNYIQVSDIDMNFDGKKDLFIFDRTAHKISTYINKGTPGKVDYVDSTFKYAAKFPHLEDWALIRDYNCDGKPDIFTYAITVGGIKVWKNTSSGGNLQFTLATDYIRSDYTPNDPMDPLSNLYVSRVDIPTIDDIDGDGDLDVLTFDVGGIEMEYHINQSVEKGYGCDSLIYDLDVSGGCWGNFNEDAFNCDVHLQSCFTSNPDSMKHIHPFSPPLSREDEWKNAIEKHTGNCSLCLDMDGDGDKEILLGQITCCNISLLTNGGSKTSANMIAKEDSFPKLIPVNQNVFPCGYYVDVNNDNKRDLIFCPNAPNISLNNNNIWYYENVGTDSTPVFSRIKKNLFQSDMIDVGEGADPVFFDYDGDGLTDLLISNHDMITDSCPYRTSFGVYAFKNIGSTTSPKFSLTDTNYANLSVALPNIYDKHLTFGDIDNDGDADMYVGDYNGNIYYFNNTAGTGKPANFTNMGMVKDYATPNDTAIDVGINATPQLIDVDRDGDLDLIIGERAGNINYYENIGTRTNPKFELNNENFGNVDVMKPCCTGYSAPFMYDSSGTYNLLVGSQASRTSPDPNGWIWYYKNIDANLNGTFTLVDSMYNHIWEGGRMIINGADINADGHIDLIIGNYAGGVSLYLGKKDDTSVPEITSPAFDFNIYPNPTSGNSFITIPSFTGNEKYILNIYNSIGEIIYSKKITRAKSKIEEVLTNGVYTCQLISGNISKTKKIVVLK